MICSAGSIAALSLFTVFAILLHPSRALPPKLVGVQGQDDQVMSIVAYGYPDNFTSLNDRYKRAFVDIEPGLRRYNAFWMGVEPTQIPSDAPMNCSEGFELVPLNETDRIARGYNMYHCYLTAFLQQFDTFLAMDAQIGAASAIIAYGTPTWAANPNCTGFPWGSSNFKGGCLPWGWMDGWYDFILLMCERYNNSWGSGHPRISGIVVWNEVQSLGWSDPSPILPNRYTGQSPIFTPAEYGIYASMIANLTMVAQRAAARYIPDITIWLSTDHYLSAPAMEDGAVGSVGLYDLLDELWPVIPVSVPWSIAVHPYDIGDPRTNLTMMGMYTFLTLSADVADYQCQKLQQVGVPGANCSQYPQTWMWASEQGWPFTASTNPFICCNKLIQARNICNAHGLALAQGLWAVTHNFFQGPFPTSQGGADYSLVDEPPVCNASLANCSATSQTYQAYMSTKSGVYGVTDAHYCCARWGAGCAGDHRSVAEIAATLTDHPKFAHIGRYTGPHMSPSMEYLARLYYDL